MGQSDCTLIRLPLAHFPRNFREDLLVNFLLITYNFAPQFFFVSFLFIEFSMENKMATPLGTVFFTAENQVSQFDDQTFGSIAEMLVIHFDQERFEQLLSGGSTNLLHVRKHMEVSVARAPLATSLKQVSIETNKALCKSITVSGKTKQTLCKSSLASAETNVASCQIVNTVRETIKVPHGPKTASAKATWIAKSVVSCETRDKSLDSASCEAKIVSDCKTILALHRAKPPSVPRG